MKIGVKTYFDEKFARYFDGKADFLEVMAVEGRDYSFLKNYSLPIVVHAEHFAFGVNIADSGLKERSLRAINFASSIADLAGAKKIILHPGTVDNADCSEKNAVSFLKGLDNRIIIENMPLKDGRMCTDVKNTEYFLKTTGRELCFDINHALSTALALKKDFLPMIGEFIQFKPAHYHIGGHLLEKDMSHLAFDEGDIPLKEIIGLLPEDAEITLETSTDMKKTEKDLKIIRNLI